jgi:Sec-independent protein translocase protein TatA
MSLTEILLVVILGVFVLKPTDLKIIGRTIGNILSYINKLKNEIFSSIEEETGTTTKDQKQINDYMMKILQLSGKYEGDYNLASVKAYYHKLLLSQHSGKDTKK